MTMQCRVCSNIKNNVTYEVPEMMYGTRETFTYFQCARCRCLQIVEIPSDMTPITRKTIIAFPQKGPMTGIRTRYEEAGTSCGTITPYFLTD